MIRTSIERKDQVQKKRINMENRERKKIKESKRKIIIPIGNVIR